jgi:pimeloyl-ACP methyl ester carboxylesterase
MASIRDGYLTTADGLRLFYRQAGSDESLAVYINGVPIAEDFAPLATGRTIVFFDPRNRGRSDAVRDQAQIERGIHHDVDDLEAIRRHFCVTTIDIIGHSYAGVTAVLYAIKHPAHVNRVVQIGPMGLDQRRSYPPPLSNADETLQSALRRLGELMKQQPALDPVEFCRRFWEVMNPIWVTDPADIPKLKKLARCNDVNERNFMPTWLQFIQPSIITLNLTPEDLAQAVGPVLVIHGTRDRSAPYGAGRDWARSLPNARLVAVEGGGHVPWIEAPDVVFSAIRTFLDGEWPSMAEAIVE